MKNKETKEQSQKRRCYKFCPNMFERCFEEECYYWFRFYWKMPPQNKINVFDISEWETGYILLLYIIFNIFWFALCYTIIWRLLRG